MSDSRKKADGSEKNPQGGIRLDKECSGRLENSSGGGTDATDSEVIESAGIPDTASAIGGWMIVLLWLMALATATYLAQGWIDDRSQRREGTVIGNDAGQQALLLTGNRFGQFRVRGHVNGQDVLFLVDTGASGISIPDKVAKRLNLQRGRAFEVSTANGVTAVYTTTLKSLSIGPFRHTKVKAHINPGMDGDMALLGMSYLRDFELVHRDGEMVIRRP